MAIKIYAQGPDQIMEAADRIVVNILHEPGTKMKKWNKPAMLDNGGFQGFTASPEELIETTEKLNPEIVIAPDVRFDAQKTLWLHKEYAELASDKIMDKTVGVFRPKLQNLYSDLQKYKKLGYNYIANPTGEGYSKGLERFWQHVKNQGFKIHKLGAQDGTYHLLHDIYFDSIDFVCQDLNEFKTIKKNIEMVEITKWRK